MPVLKLSSEPPLVNLDNLELFLDNDALFVEYFNAFLALPSFALRLRYDAAAGVFDMVGGGCWACRAVRAMNRGENPTPFLRESRRASREGCWACRAVRAMNRGKNPTPFLRESRRSSREGELVLSYYGKRSAPRTDSVGGGGCWACRAVRAMNRGENPTPFLRESRRSSREDHTLGAQLDKLQGLVWIKVHRLPAFLQSRYYSKYRLAKLLSQVPACTSGLYLHVDPDFRPWAPRHALEDPDADSKDSVNDEDEEFDRFVKSMCVCLGQTSPTQTKQWYAWAKQAETTTTSPSDQDPNNPPPNTASYGTLFKQKGFDVYMAKPPTREKKVPSREMVRMAEGGASRSPSPYLHSPAACMGVDTELTEPDEGDAGCVEEDPCGYLAVYGRGIADKTAMSEFGEFLRSTSGEVKWSLWLDADHTRFIQCVHKMGAFLAKLQTKYLHSSSPLRLSMEMEQKLGLQRIRDWRPDRLQEAQSLLVQPLLQYWLPRFLRTRDLGSPLISYEDSDVSLDSSGRPTSALILLHYWLPRFLRTRDHGSPLISYEGSDVSLDSSGRPTSATSLGFDAEDVTSRPQSCIPRLRSSTEAARRIYGGGRATCWTEYNRKKSTSRSRSARLAAQKHPSTPLVDQLQSESNIAHTKSSQAKNKKDKNDEAKRKQEELRMKRDLERRFPVTKVRPRKSASASRRPKSSPGAESDMQSFCLSATRPPTAPSSTAGRATPSSKCEHEGKGRGKSREKPPNRPHTAGALTQHDEQSVGTQQPEATQVEQTLVHDKRAGNFFEEFCEASGNKIWVNAVDFWRDLQEYRRLFNTEPRQDYNIQRKARRLYSRYIVAGASRSILCPVGTSHEVGYIVAGASRSILCPVDTSHEVGCSLSAEAHGQDTFSAVEEHALLVLKEAWLAMRSEEADLLVGPLKIPH
ncbi:GTPase activator [Branchiostoma belcheri]|nr:GTPase activator [Branchiostoma belcheri]